MWQVYRHVSEQDLIVRISRVNRLLRLSDQHKRVAEEDIRNESYNHLHDLQLF
jgi:hypothetical protein